MSGRDNVQVCDGEEQQVWKRDATSEGESQRDHEGERGTTSEREKHQRVRERVRVTTSERESQRTSE